MIWMKRKPAADKINAKTRNPSASKEMHIVTIIGKIFSPFGRCLSGAGPLK